MIVLATILTAELGQLEPGLAVKKSCMDGSDRFRSNQIISDRITLGQIR
jgi:hypothetical protein